jgi:magnesium chelatase family protein
MTDLTLVTLTPHGGEPHEVLVHVDVLAGARSLIAVGPDGTSCPELRDRVYAGITNSGLTWPGRNVTVFFEPLGRWPVHPSTDLAVTAAVLAAVGHLPFTALNDTLFIGEVGLDGAVRPIPETLALVAAAAERRYRTVVVPAGNARQAILVPGVHVIAVNSLTELLAWAVTGTEPPLPAPLDASAIAGGPAEAQMVDLPAWLSPARFALEVAAAGRHHLGVTATPGLPVTMIAESVRSLLPDLDNRQAVEVSALYAAAGHPVDALIRRPPLQAVGPHTSVTALIGGRRPGVVSLAHHGIVLLHDAPDVTPAVLQALRPPLDHRIVQVARARGAITFPADVQLIATARPCPCAADHRPSHGCSSPARRRYRNRMHPICDRLDINVTVTPAASGEAAAGRSSADIAAQVVAARTAAADRWAQKISSTNADVPVDVLHRDAFRLPASATSGLRRMVDTGRLSARGYGRILRLAWTVSDLRGAERPDKEAVDTAVELHVPPRNTT